MNFTGNIVKDFEDYLISSKLMIKNYDRPFQWIERLGKIIEDASLLHFEENYFIKDFLPNLIELQKFYGYSYDLFGSYLEFNDNTNQKLGQFFTPMGVSMLTAELSFNYENLNRTIRVADECSGTARMMIAHHIVSEKKIKNLSPLQYFYYNKDIDYKCFIFSTLNAILRNLFSENVWGDCIAATNYKVIFTYPSTSGRSIWFNTEGFFKSSEFFIKKAS